MTPVTLPRDIGHFRPSTMAITAGRRVRPHIASTCASRVARVEERFLVAGVLTSQERRRRESLSSSLEFLTLQLRFGD
jgi:hypothetical protein